MTKNINFVAVDWGSSHLRCWKIENNVCQQQRHTQQGIKFVTEGQHECVLLTLLEPWREWIENAHIPVIIAGMAGSDAGWVDSGYQRLPLNIQAIASGCISLPSTLKAPVWLRPGIAWQDDHHANVMRGEEVQLLGAIEMVSADIYLFPGTHSKWVKPNNQDNDIVLTDFSTAITGELYQLLIEYSLMGKGLPANAPMDYSAFQQGCDEALRGKEGLLNQLFYARSLRLMGKLADTAAASWLSGLLIGSELSQLKQCHPSALNIALIADAPLSHYYQYAAQLLGLSTQLIDPQTATLNGFRNIYATL